MRLNENNLDENGSKLSRLMNRHNRKLKFVAVFALLISTVTFNLGFAKETDKEEFSKIFHVYVAEVYIGSVANEETVQEIIKEKEQQANNQYDQFDVDASSNIKIIPEQVFTVDTNEEQTLKNLQEAITVQAKAHSLQVGGIAIASLKDEQDIEAVIDGLKLQYVNKEQLEELKSRNSNVPLPELKIDETRLVDVTLSEEITGQETSVNPEEIVTTEKAIQLLQTGSLENEVYEVKSGDVLGSIASAHGLTIAQLLQLNPSITENTLLQIGQQLNVTVEKPFVTVKAIYEKKFVEEIDFNKVVIEDETLLKGERIVKQEGTKGKREVSYTLIEENGVRTDRVQTDETILEEPKDYIVVVGTKVIPSVGTGTFAWPAVGGYVSSQMGNRWGRYHYGIDIARPSNYTIKASDNGVVTTAGRHATYGNYVVVNHNNGFETIYAHLSSIDVSVGKIVEQGSALGEMGSTGRSTGTHLHFEILKNGSQVNPMSYLN